MLFEKSRRVVPLLSMKMTIAAELMREDGRSEEEKKEKKLICWALGPARRECNNTQYSSGEKGKRERERKRSGH